MKLNVLERSKNELRMELVGEGHSFCNALQTMLLKDKTVDFAGYNIQHPLIANPVLYIRTKGRRRPETALVEGAKSLGKNLANLEMAFRKAFKEYVK